MKTLARELKQKALSPTLTHLHEPHLADLDLEHRVHRRRVRLLLRLLLERGRARNLIDGYVAELHVKKVVNIQYTPIIKYETGADHLVMRVLECAGDSLDVNNNRKSAH